MRIYLKPRKRCSKCGHLVLADRTECPYCGDVSLCVTVVNTVNTIHPASKSVSPTIKPLDKKTIKIGLIAAGIVAFIIAAFFIFKADKIRMSVFEPMDTEYAIDKNKELPGFADMCTKVNSARQKFGNIVEYKEITYERLYGYYHDFYNNPDTIGEIRQTAIAEHDEKHRKPMAPNVQSTLFLWDDYVRKHDINNYLQVNVVTDYLVQEDYYDRYYRPKIYFDLSYPSGEYAIKDCFSVLRIDYDNISELLDLKTLKNSDNPKQSLYLRRVDNSSFWDYHTATVEIFNITLRDGTKIYANDINNVPYSVKMYQANKSLENEERIIKELINSNYITQSEYVSASVEKELMEKDPLCYKFVKEFML